MSERTRFTAFVTKYALSSGGIREIEVEDCFDISPDMVMEDGMYWQSYRGKEWHRTREAAVARAEEMRIAKIASLEKQIARLRKIQFAP